MCRKCQNIYDCPAEDISKKQQGTELAIARAILLMQLPRILFHLLFKFSSFLFPAMKQFLSALLRKEPIVPPPRCKMGEGIRKQQPCCSASRIYPWVLGKYLWPDFSFSFGIHQIAHNTLFLKTNTLEAYLMLLAVHLFTRSSSLCPSPSYLFI